MIFISSNTNIEEGKKKAVQSGMLEGCIICGDPNAELLVTCSPDEGKLFRHHEHLKDKVVFYRVCAIDAKRRSLSELENAISLYIQ